MIPQRKHEGSRWQEANELRQLVWGMRGLRGEPKCAWWVLWWDLGLGRGGALDVTAAQVATAIGAADAASGRRALIHLAEAGLIEIDSRAPNDAPGPARGRWTIYMPDPRDVLIGRRQASHGQGELFGDHDAGRGSTEPESSPVAGRVSDEAQSAGLATEPGAPPVEPRGGSVRTGRTAADVQAHPPPTAAEAQAHPPTPTCTWKDLSRSHLKLEHFALVDPSSSKISRAAKNRGGSAGASAAVPSGVLPTVGNALADLLATFDRMGGLSLAAELAEVIPGLWGDWAELLVAELEGARDAEHGGEATPLTRAELARLVVSSRRKLAEGKLHEPLPVYFTGAVNSWLVRQGRKRIFVAKSKPR
ncbi:MAG TPA: hypothetical protein VG826_29125 [Pirellulales bacterium]|nr:hypothetical protein [Pirellulales bacterium]